MLKKTGKKLATSKSHLKPVARATSEALVSTSIQQSDRPKILTLDLESTAEDALRMSGFNITLGSFGTPYRVKAHDGYIPVIGNGEVPANVTEQEVIIIDLQAREPLEGPVGEKHTPDGTNDWWVSCVHGEVDPRPRLMASLQSTFDKIYEHGGIFIIFSAPRQTQKLAFAHLDRSRGLTIDGGIPCDNWTFLSLLTSPGFEAEHEFGEEIEIVDIDAPIIKALQNHLAEASFNCTFSKGLYGKNFITLAVNKYKEPVAAIFPPDDSNSNGWIIILPDIQDKASFLKELLNDVLPPLAPNLFPNSESAFWADQPEYDFPEIVELKAKIRLIVAATEETIADLERQIEAERAARQYLVDLLGATGKPLVSAVKRALEVLGFETVIDVDDVIKSDTSGGSLSEDLRIEDKSPLLLVEVKGVNGKPSDSESTQVQKNVTYRMQELKRLDIKGLTIINHERHLPPLDRENQTPFRDVILTNANHYQFGLLTTWDLVRLIRSFGYGFSRVVPKMRA